MATPVVCGWAVAVFEVPQLLSRSSEANDRKNKTRNKGTNRRTDDIAGCKFAQHVTKKPEGRREKEKGKPERLRLLKLSIA